jgi:putative hemolysin
MHQVPRRWAPSRHVPAGSASYCAKVGGGSTTRWRDAGAEPKEVAVYGFAPEGDLVDGELSFRLDCESGTYARSLAHDLGERLGCGAHLKRLRRTRIATGSDRSLVSWREARANAPLALRGCR